MSRAATSERLQKVLARCGCGSRREIEDLIRAGGVAVNGARAELGVRLVAGDLVSIRGERYQVFPSQSPAARVLAYHKPEGELCTRRDPQRRPTVYAHLPRVHRGRWLSIGRLDVNSSGLLLLTTDGELANRLMHPSAGIEREYAVRVYGEVSDAQIARLCRGVHLEDGPARFERVEFRGGEGASRWYHVVLREGRNREVRRLWGTQGVQVARLVRVRFAQVQLPRGLRPGRHRELDRAEVAALRAAAGLPAGPGGAGELRIRARRPRRR